MRNDNTDSYAAWCNAEQLYRMMSGTQFLEWLVDELGTRCVSYDDSNVHMMTRNGELIHLYLVHSVWWCKA